MRAGLLIILIFLAAGCAPNDAILKDTSGAAPDTTPTPAAAPEPAKRLTVGELMERVASAPEDAFLFPCTLNAYKEGDRDHLAAIREKWMAREKDDRYLIAPASGCVCPDACVLVVEDVSAQPPRNSALIAIGDVAGESYTWLAKGVDLTRAELAWEGTAAVIRFRKADGSQEKSCTITRGPKAGSFTPKCTDANGKPAALLD